jgi:hypothetical protein
MLLCRLSAVGASGRARCRNDSVSTAIFASRASMQVAEGGVLDI